MLYTNITGFTSAANSPKTPIFKIEYVDSPYGVPSKGYAVEYYEDPTNSSTTTFDASYLAMQGRDNILSYDWSLGAPPGITTTDYFKAQYYGYFYARFTGLYTFFLSKDKNDYARFFFNRTRTVTDPSNASTYIAADLKINDWPIDAGNPTGDYQAQETLSFTVTLTSGRWYPFLVQYAERTKEAYISVRYLEPSNVIDSNGEYSDNDISATNHPYPVQYSKVLSAGITNYSKLWLGANSASYLPSIILSGVDNVTFNKVYNQSNLLEFKVPILVGVTTTSGLMGFRYDYNTGLYYDDNSNTFLKQGRLVKYYVGYSSNGSNPSSYDYIQRFEGIITDFNINREAKNSSITIKCQDIMYHAISSIEENYPNKISYINFDFTSANTAGEPNGYSRPMAYDAWPVVDMVRDLYMKAGIDPVKLYGRRKILNRDSGYSWGDYYIEDRQINLKRKPKYGNPNTIGDTNNADDKYIWGTEFGKPIFDKIARVADLYGYVTEVSNEGYPTFYSVNSPVIYEPDDSITWTYSSLWTDSYDLKADGGHFKNTNVINSYLEADVDGSAFVINFIKTNKDYQDYTSSGWSLEYNEFPLGQKFDTNMKSTNSYLGCLYGRQPYTFLGNFVGYNYINSTFYFTPQASFTATGLEIETAFDLPDYIEYRDDTSINIGANIYFGRTTNYTDLVSSSLIYSNFIRPRVNYSNNRKFSIQFGTNMILTGGHTYGIRFLTVDNTDHANDPYKNQQLIYKISHCALDNPYLGIHNSAYLNRAYESDGVITSITTGVSSLFTDTGTIQKTIFPSINIKGVPNTLYDSNAKIDVYALDSNTLSFNLVKTWTVSNLYSDRTNTDEEFRFTSDGRDFTGKNPTRFYISSRDLGNNTVNGTVLSYGTYKIRITNLNNVGSGTLIDSIEAYYNDIYNPTYIFDTKTNIKSLGVNSTITDIRNDVIVVGDLIGAFKDYSTDKVINKNNPTYQYIYSRATDIDSINNPDSINNVGKKKPFLIFEPSVVDQKHADWLAEAILYRYRLSRKIPSWESYGIPFIETNDNVFVVDYNTGAIISDINGYNNQWITEINETISNKSYYMSFSTTPYEPWSSFVQNKNPDITNFGNQPIINVKMTDSNGSLRGYNGNSLFDVYETESGNRLRIQYDQVLDGDLIVKVMSKNILGFTEERTIAYLVGKLEEGFEVPEYREWGSDYSLYWDGIDQTGASRKNLIRYDGLNDYISSFDSPGFYATSGDYFVRFILYPKDISNNDGTYSFKNALTLDTTNLLINFNTEVASDRLISALSSNDIYEQLWRINWGDPIDVYMSVSGELSSVGRDLTYFPNNSFYSEDNSTLGAKIKFTTSGNVNSRILYYKSDIEHIWGLGYTFHLRSDSIPYGVYGSSNPLDVNFRHSLNAATDWKTAFEYAIKGNYGLSKYDNYGDDTGLEEETIFDPGGGYDKDWVDWDFPAHLYGAGGGQDISQFTRTSTTWGEKQSGKPLEIDHKYEIILTGGEYRVVGWYSTPYTNYSIENYIPETIHKCSDENAIEFYLNPQNTYAGGWTFEAVPDMNEDAYSYFRRTLTLMAYYNGAVNQQDSVKKLKLITSHAFQVKTTMWDLTGRLLKNDKQLAIKQADPHNHTIYSSTGYTGDHSHTAYDTTFIMSPSNWGSDPKPESLFAKNVLLETRVSGLVGYTDNAYYKYGIGFCNVSGSVNYGAWTWHGYWLSLDATKVDLRIPFNHLSFPSTLHWFKQDSSFNDYVIYHWETESRQGDYYVYQLSSTAQPNLAQSLSQAVTASVGKHAHPFIYEGINAAKDQFGVLDFGVNESPAQIGITGFENSLGTFNSCVFTLYDAQNLWNAESRYDRLTVDSNFPKIWYYIDNISLPVSGGGTEPWDSFWTKYLIDSGFSFYHGGWSRYLPDQQN